MKIVFIKFKFLLCKNPQVKENICAMSKYLKYLKQNLENKTSPFAT